MNLKFRVWDINDKYMAYPGDCVGIDPKADTELMYCDMETVAVGMDGEIYLLDECGRWDYPSNPSLNKEVVIMPYVGLSDKNGTEIYKGDIVKAWVNFGPGGDRLIITEVRTTPFGTNFQEWTFIEKGRLPEVIGNIYENPELLSEDTECKK